MDVVWLSSTSKVGFPHKILFSIIHERINICFMQGAWLTYFLGVHSSNFQGALKKTEANWCRYIAVAVGSFRKKIKKGDIFHFMYVISLLSPLWKNYRQIEGNTFTVSMRVHFIDCKKKKVLIAGLN